MVVFDGTPWYPSSFISSNSPKEFKGLRFRGVSDSLAEKHVEGSECCLIHADNPLREKKGIYVNPNVRVGYKREVYEMVNGKGGWPGRWEAVRGVWGARLGWVREWGSGWVERGLVGRRVQTWMEEGEGEESREELGLECLINEMQVLYQSGWRHL